MEQKGQEQKKKEMKMSNKMFNELILLASDETKKKNRKGDGINAILKLMMDFRDFQDSIDECIAAQTMGDIKNKVESLNTDMEKMWTMLSEIVTASIRSIKSDIGGGDMGGEGLVDKVEKGVDKAPVTESVSVPQKPKMF